MIWTIYKKFQLSFAQNTNRFIYSLKKIKFLGNYISEEWYVRMDIKKLLGILSLIWAVVWDVLTKVFYFGGIICLPGIILTGLLEWDAANFAAMLICVFFFLNCMLGSFMNSKITEKACDEDEYVLLNLMRFNPKEHYLTTILWENGKQFVYYGIMIYLVAVRFYHMSLFHYFWLMAAYAAFRFIGEAARLKINDKLGMPFQQKNKVAAGWYYIYNVLIFCLGYGIVPVLFFVQGGKGIVELPLVHNYPLMLVLLAVILVAGVLSVGYLWGYQDYVLVARRMCNMQNLQEIEAAVEKASNNSYALQDDEVKEEELKERLYPEKKGYDYLNAIFFQRHKKLVRNVVRAKAIVVGIAFGAATIALIVANVILSPKEFAEVSDMIWKNVKNFVPILVFIMYCASSGQNLTKAMFYNCDIFLLKQGYYRSREAILQGFKIRLSYMLKAELPTLLIFCGGIIADTLLLRQQQNILQMLSLLLCVCSLTVFYSVLFLCMYYIFQPFTEGGSQTGFGYRACSAGIYLLSYMCMQMGTVPTFFSSLVLAVTVVLLVAGFAIAWMVAPKTFRLK